MFKIICTVALAIVLSLLVDRLALAWLNAVLIYLGILALIAYFDALIAAWREDRKSQDSIRRSL